jgi:type IV pilus assembly protein PilQ
MRNRCLIIFVFVLIPAWAMRSPFEFKSEKKASINTSLATIKLHYLNAKDVAILLKSIKRFPWYGKSVVYYDQRSDLLVLQSSKLALAKMNHFVHAVDKPIRQVLVRASIINVDEQYMRQLGLSYTQSQAAISGHSIDKMLIPIYKIATGSLLSARLSLLQRQGHATLIADPILFTLNHQQASIESGEEIPYQQATRSGATSVAFKKAVVSLKITPDILPGNKLLLKIQVSQDGVSNMKVHGEPAIKTQQLSTQVLLRNKQFVVLGGIFSRFNSEHVSGIPGLKDIPLFGAMFRTHDRISRRKELLLVVYPKIVTTA